MANQWSTKSTSERALHASEVIGAIPALLASAESLYNRVKGRASLDDWAVSRKSYASRPALIRGGLDFLGNEAVNTALHVARVTANVTLLVAPRRYNTTRGVASLISGLATALLSPRERYGSDGADQATTVVQLSNAVGRLSWSKGSTDAALWNVSVQSTLSYAAAGYVKLAGSSWRDGTAVASILRTRAYGHRHIWTYLEKRPRLARALTYLVLVFECTFPVIYVLPVGAARLLSCAALSFHLANGYAMGLWRFVFAFASMHPQLLYTVTAARGSARISHKTPLLFALSTSAILAASVYSATMRRRRVLSSQSGADSVINRADGSTLAFESRQGTSQDLPLLVFENGLLGLPEHYAWIRHCLEAEGYSTLTYSRVGYGPSRVAYNAPRPDYTIESSVDDLEQLVLSRASQPVVLIGHSIGAEIVRRMALRKAFPVQAVVYLDPTHPAQIERSESQRSNIADFTSNLTSFHFSTLISLGTFLNTPAWIKTLPVSAQRSALDQFRDNRLWATGRREWARMKLELAEGREVAQNHEVPALLISAGRTLSGDPSIDALHDEILAGHDRTGISRRVILNDITHDSLLTSGNHARECANEILAFLRVAGLGASK